MNLYQLQSALMAPLQVESVQLKVKRIVVEREEKCAGGMQDVLVLQVLLLRLRLRPQRLHPNLQPVALVRDFLVARIATAAVVTAQVKEGILTNASKTKLQGICKMNDVFHHNVQ